MSSKTTLCVLMSPSLVNSKNKKYFKNMTLISLKRPISTWNEQKRNVRVYLDPNMPDMVQKIAEVLGHLNTDFSQPYARSYCHLVCKIAFGQLDCGSFATALFSAYCILRWGQQTWHCSPVWRCIGYTH